MRPLLGGCVVLAFLTLAPPVPAADKAEAGCAGRLRYYGTYSVGTKAGDRKIPLPERLRELRSLGANMVVGTGDETAILDLLPQGMLAVPGCGLMKKEDWQRDGQFDEAQARVRLAKLAARFARHPRVHGVCLTHEVTEYADHARRRWMYRLAKEYFKDKPVIQYYGVLWDEQNPRGEKVSEYGKNGEVETDVLFVSLQGASRDGRFDPGRAKKLSGVLEEAARTPGVPVWVQTSINADHKYVTGPESMRAVWGDKGDNMPAWLDAVLAASNGKKPGLEGFFWRSLGRFPWDLGFPAFAGHREQMRVLSAKVCRGS